MSFKLFQYLDKALVSMESRSDYVSKSARVWPSEASAILFDPSTTPVIGGCHRKIFYRLTGEKTTSQMDAVGGRRVRTGKSVEEDVTQQAMEAGLHIASGVRHYVPSVDLAFELDLVVLDPATGQPVICENKSIYGYDTTKKIFGNSYQKGKPKLEHLLQILLYINEIHSGAVFKSVVEAAVLDKPNNKRNRVRTTEDNLAIVKDDAQIYGKLCYETRDTCETCEFDVEIYEDFDGLHYPVVNGDIWKIFTVESIYNRFEIVQEYYNKAQKEAIGRLQAQDIIRPVSLPEGTDKDAVIGWKEAEKVYWDRVGEEMRRLGPEYLPPNDYEWQYSDNKIESLRSKGLISDTKWKEYQTWKKGKRRKAGTPHIGDWQCGYCSYRLACIPLQKPELAGMCNDLVQIKDDTDELPF